MSNSTINTYIPQLSSIMGDCVRVHLLDYYDQIILHLMFHSYFVFILCGNIFGLFVFVEVVTYVLLSNGWSKSKLRNVNQKKPPYTVIAMSCITCFLLHVGQPFLNRKSVEDNLSPPGKHQKRPEHELVITFSFLSHLKTNIHICQL